MNRPRKEEFKSFKSFAKAQDDYIDYLWDKMTNNPIIKTKYGKIHTVIKPVEDICQICKYKGVNCTDIMREFCVSNLQPNQCFK